MEEMDEQLEVSSEHLPSHCDTVVERIRSQLTQKDDIGKKQPNPF